MKQIITIYSPPCVCNWIWGTYRRAEEDIWYLRVVFLRAFNIPASWNAQWNLPDLTLDFCAKTSGFITWLVYPITESLSLTHSIHRNYHFANPTQCFSLSHVSIFFFSSKSSKCIILKIFSWETPSAGTNSYLEEKVNLIGSINYLSTFKSSSLNKLEFIFSCNFVSSPVATWLWYWLLFVQFQITPVLV